MLPIKLEIAVRASERACPVCLREEGVELFHVPSAIPMKYDGTFETRTHSADATHVKCLSCGEFLVTEQDYVNLKSARLRTWKPCQLSSLLREQTIRPLPNFWLQFGMAPYGPVERTDLTPIDLHELLTRWPHTMADRIDRTLCNMAVLSPTGGHRVLVDPKDTALIFAEKIEEAIYHLNALREYGLVTGRQSLDLSPSALSLTPSGWARFEELTRGKNAPENPVFVAMWFGGGTDASKVSDAYLKAIEPAVRKAGYQVTRVDLAEHNDWIMDKVLGDIRRAPFLVADFTGNRNGVYFEAGFARGLGIPVINTCHDDHFENAHFDIQQLNLIRWKSLEDLETKLLNRILGAIGKGPHS